MSGGDGFFKRGKIWWFRTDPLTGKQASSGKRDRRSAEIEYTTRARLASDPSYQPAAEADASLNHWAVKFVEYKRATKAGHTASFYAAKLGHVVRLFGADAAISVALRPQAFDQYALTRKTEGARATTIRKEIGAARTLARFAARHGAYHGRPELFMPGDLADDYEPGERFLTPEELFALMAELPEHRAVHVGLAVAVGCRYSETFRVRPEDVDTERWLVYIRGTKTKRSRAEVPVAEPFRGLLARVLPGLPVKRWLNANMKRDLAVACRKAGIPPVTANDLRRTHGSWLAQAGVGDEHIGKVLRHADGRMARRVYGRLPPEQLGRLVNATIVQQLPARGHSSASENIVEPDGSEGVDMRIENPRVGGSIPSRDTTKSPCESGVTDDGECRDVAQTDAETRSVRNDSATVGAPEVGGFVKHRSRVQVSQSAPVDGPHRLGPSCGHLIRDGQTTIGACQREPGHDCEHMRGDTGWYGPQPPPSSPGDFAGLPQGWS